MSAPVVVSDMDGTLATVDTWRGVLAWINEQHPSPAARRFVRVRLPLVALAKAGIGDKEAFRARWMSDMSGLLRDLPAARLAELGEWVVTQTLWPARREQAIDAVRTAAGIARATNPGARLVLATGAYKEIGEAFGRRIDADVVIATPLAMRDGVATGTLQARVQSGEAKAGAVLAAADGGEVLAAFGDTEADIPMLRLATRAVAVAPDKRLRREAVDRGWELLEA
jgi:HAD superfamily phosphoserine phosphatase-like hydrolase